MKICHLKTVAGITCSAVILAVAMISPTAPLAAEAPIAAASVSSTAPGILTEKKGKVTIDYSNSSQGYVMVNYNDKDVKLKVRITGPATTYTYDLHAGKWEAFPLSEGDGNYVISVFRCVDGKRYVSEASKTVSAVLVSEKIPFIHSNQFVDFDNAPNTKAKASELTAGLTTELEKVAAVYDFVVTGFTYDYQLANTVQSGYIPVLDTILEAKKGICFDYASIMTGMLRSQGIPTKLVIGYAGTVYHAWISIWVEGQGWIDQAIYFDGTQWKRMDPTFASTSNRSNLIMEYINNDANYSVRYCY
ncbi:MAG: transglutaminase domain-containing protein [Firmicutes bacterium]|nr:transglutaminase domain-containing protein [Bacillota bacterium]